MMSLRILAGMGALLALLLGAPPSALCQDGSDAVPASMTADEIQACVQRNVPHTTSIQVVEFTSVDRVGNQRVSRAKIYGKRFEDGLRKVLLHFSKPRDLRGSAFLMLEREDGNGSDMFMYSPELRKVKRVSGTATASSLFGTDFSGEDFERLQGISRPGALKRLDDSEYAGREVYQLETLPSDDAESMYTKVLNYIDQETCVALKTDSYERGERVRKELTCAPEDIEQHNKIWVPQKLLMRDLRDETHTDLVIESIELDVEIKDRQFSLNRLDKAR